MKKKLDFYFAPLHPDSDFFVRSIGDFCLLENDRDYPKKANFAELFWCIDGEGEFEYNNDEFQLRKNQIWYYPSGSFHRIRCSGKFFHYRWLAIGGSNADILFRGVHLLPGVNDAGECPEELFNRITLNINSISAKVQMENMATAFKILTTAVSKPMQPHKSLVDKVKTIVEEYFSNADLSVERIAELLHVDRTVLSKIFSAQQHTAIVKYIAARRMREAGILLRETNLPIREIAALCGYSTHNYFTKAVKNFYGMTPQEIRMSYRN